MWEKTRRKKEVTLLEKLIKAKGGVYRTSGRDSVFFHLYTNVQFSPVKAERRSFTIGLTTDTPPGTPRDPTPKKRMEYWEHSKRLQSGSLIALLIVSPGQMQIYLGVVTSNGTDIAESARSNEDRIQLRVSFFDAEVELSALRREKISNGPKHFAVLVDNSIMYESLRPFLETLQTIEPTSIPFARYICAEDSLKSVPVLVPRYGRAPGFRFKLGCLARRGATIHNMNPLDTASIARARQELATGSDLDVSQAQAMIDSLTREVSLLQGYVSCHILMARQTIACLIHELL